ncbi:MAG: gfo/Idh/MocA family oxidoreductase [Betaproteobacteria bacterium]|nr:MAG: gfo/Idh/MocA family oxidoreductase [Betaproteobacteria bacterium]TAG46197.1 MAG: gfo/Idh/MocA family oxidoreductase [Betaproteobacteria bacterium]
MIAANSNRKQFDPSSPARVAVVGAGYFSQFHHRGWAAEPSAKLVAICDSNEQASRSAAQNFAGCQSFTSAEQMLSVLDADVIDIVTPPATHAALITLCVGKGKHVICQKPFASNYSEALELTNLAASKGVDLLIHENFRFMPWYREAKRLIDSGQLGRLHSAMFRLRPGDGQGADAYLSRQPYFQNMRRFLVVETAIHFIDTFRYLMGEVVAVYARLRRVNPAIAGEDAGVIVFEFANGSTGILDANRCNDHVATNPRRTMGEMWLEGETRTLRLDGEARLWLKPHQGEEREHDYVRQSANDGDFGGGACGALQAHALSFFSRSAAGENRAVDYLINLRIQEAIYASHESGKRIVVESFSPPSSSLLPTL